MITISYKDLNQTCLIVTDTIDNNWKQLRFYYSEVSPESILYEDAIELPWHVFISNLEIIVLAKRVHKIDVSYTDQAKLHLNESLAQLKSIKSIESSEAIPIEHLQGKLEGLGFKRKLTDQQKRNVSRLSRLAHGATFSVPGAGKTTEALAFYTLHRKPGQNLIVICPKNAFPAWEEQVDECLNDPPKVVRLQGKDKIDNLLSTKEVTVFLISYQQFIISSEKMARLLHHHPSFVFIDESHRMKGGSRTETGRSIQKIAHLPVGKLIMSGTPLPNSIEDLIPQYSFLFPSESAIDENNITEKIQKVYVRTTKIELGLKEPHIIRTQIPLHESQKELYDLIRSEELRQLSSLTKNDRKFYRQLGKSYMRLLQIVSNPSLLLKSISPLPDQLREVIEYGASHKLQYAAIKARQLAKEGKKVLIWSGFVENVESMTTILRDLKARCIHGGVEAGSEEEENSRERIVKDFHDDMYMYALVANPAACSEGISLHTVCHHAIYIDRNYNAAQFLQSMDRIHRLGLAKDQETVIEILHSPNTIDDLIDSRLKDKIQRMSMVLDDPSLNKEPITVELDEEGFDEEDAKQLLLHLKGFL